MRAALLIFVFSALFASCVAIDVEIKLIDLEFDNPAPFKCWSTLEGYEGFEKFNPNKPYIHVYSKGFHNSNKDMESIKNSAPCSWNNNICSWQDGYRIRLRRSKGNDGIEDPHFTLNLRNANKDFDAFGLFPTLLESYSMPYNDLNFIYSQVAGKGKITKELQFKTSLWDPKRCHAPTVKISFEVKEAPPLFPKKFF